MGNERIEINCSGQIFSTVRQWHNRSYVVEKDYGVLEARPTLFLHCYNVIVLCEKIRTKFANVPVYEQHPRKIETFSIVKGHRGHNCIVAPNEKSSFIQRTTKVDEKM